MKQCGAVDKTLQKVQEFTKDAFENLAKIDVASVKKQPLQNLANHLMFRAQ